jgi:hypothetical protein
MKKMDISIPDEAKFQNAVAEHLAKEPGKIESGEMLLKELKTIMAQQNVQIREDPKLPGSQINKSLFESTVEGLLNANAIGFLGKHQAALKRVQDLALLVDVRQRQYEELKQNETAQAKQLQDRVVYEQGMLNDLAKARTRTKDMAEALLALQQELFVAQVNLAGVHEYNLYLAERLKEQERKAKPKSGGGK